MHYRVCRDCGEEFRAEIARCSDCGGELTDVHEGMSAPEFPVPEEAPPAPEPDLADFRPIFVGAQAALLVPLAERLKEETIAFRLAEAMADPDRGTASYSLLVREADRAAALEVLAPLLDESTDPSRLRAVERHFDASGGYSRCPACDSEIPAGATECPDCGLGVGGDAGGSGPPEA